MASWIKDFQKGFEQDMIRALRDLGIAAMKDAYAKKRFTNRTGNLHDSYACAVYVRGELVKSTVRYLDNPISTKRDQKTKKNGHQTAHDYLYGHSFTSKKDDFILVVIAAMYYAGILEREPHYINVISPARDYIDSNWKSATSQVFNKYGIKDKPTARVIKGDPLRR